MKERTGGYIGLALILLLALYLRIDHIGDPWIYPHNANGAIFSQAARNHLRHGLATTKGGMLLTPGASRVETGDFYINHPPLLALLLAADFAVLGESELSARLLPLLFNLLSILFLFRLVRRLFDTRTALLSAFFMAVVPLSSYYGKMVNFEPISLFLGLALLDSWHLHIRTGRNKYLVFAHILTLLGTLTDWSFVLLPPLLFINHLGLGGWKKYLGLMLTLTASLIINAGHILILVGAGGIIDLAAKGLARASISGGESGPPSVISFFLEQSLLFTMYHSFTIIGWLVVLVGGIGLSHDALRGRVAMRHRFTLILLIWGASYIAVFSNAAWIHDYWQYLLLPGASILAGHALAGRGVPRIAIAAVMMILITLFSAERLSWYYGRNDTYNLDIRAARMINEETFPADEIFTEFESLPHHLLYYGDRRIVHLGDLSDSRTFEVAPPGHPWLLAVSGNDIALIPISSPASSMHSDSSSSSAGVTAP